MSLTIQTKNLVKIYGSRTVVNNVSFNVKQGEIVGLLGPNGAGKTTSFYQVVGLVKPDEGEVFLNDINITKLPMYKRAQMGIGYLPQEASVFRKLSVEDNISAVLEMTKLSKAEQKEKLESLLDEFRLQRVRKNNGDTLSGGERRRTEIARALAVDPKFILLDEPFAGVDPIAVEDIQAIIAKLKFKNIGILITDHNVTETLSICDRAYLLIDGKIFTQGTAEELAANEQVRVRYLGRNFELKRKDYLHDEAANSQHDISSSRLASLLAYATEKIDYFRQSMQLFSQSKTDYLLFNDLKDFGSSFEETSLALKRFAADNSLKNLSILAGKIEDKKIPEKVKLSTMDIVAGNLLPAILTSFLGNVSELADIFDDTKVLLTKSKNIVENPALDDLISPE
ncbi:LPS export ABC transporter ATP-binding protein [Ferruginibacter sp. SUN106]|uniref:LPS export ABC transporter ATP-binding protein n=1 Tax=Ferruginibacter sp. SUN106 TaxID=2978348 RepID=UPI003D35D3D8